MLEVFKYDPLHTWYAPVLVFNQALHSLYCMTAGEMKPKKAQSRTRVTSELTEAAFKFAAGLHLSAEAAGEAADRALSSIQRKLDITSIVELAVNEFFQQAADVFSLANMLHGQRLSRVRNTRSHLIYFLYVGPTISRHDAHAYSQPRSIPTSSANVTICSQTSVRSRRSTTVILR